jgi:hypothetical protein
MNKRGKQKTPTLVHINVRVPVEVINYFKQFPSYTGEIREVLTKHVKEKTTTNNI